MTIDLDVFAGATWRHVDGRVTDIKRYALASDIEGDTIEEEQTNLRDELLSVPLVEGTPYPPPFQGNTLREIAPRQLSKGFWLVELTYRLDLVGESDPGFSSSVRFTGTLERITTQFDRDGNQVTVKHEDDEIGGTIAVTEAHRTAFFSKLIQTSDPMGHQDAFLNRINATPIWGGAAGEWLCVGLDVEPYDRETFPPIWEAAYTFEKKVGGWQPSAVYRDKATGEPPKDLVVGEGVKTFDHYFEAEFSALNL